MSDSPRIDSLDEFPPESLDLYSSTAAEPTGESTSLIAIVPAPPVTDADASSAGPSLAWHRRRRGRRSTSTAPAASAGRWRLAVPAIRVRLVTATKRTGATIRRAPRIAAPGSVENDSSARARRRARIRRTITEAAGRDSLARVATVSQLAPVVARVVATTSSSVALRLHATLQFLAAAVRLLASSVRSTATRVTRRLMRAIASSGAFVGAAAASVGSVAAGVSGQVGSHLQSGATFTRQRVSAAARTMRGVAPHAVGAVRMAGRMLHPRSVAVAGAMLALIVMARPDSGLGDMSAGRPESPATAAAIATAPIPVDVPAPQAIDPAGADDRGPATPPATVASAALAPAATPEAVPDNRAVRIDPRAIQSVLNRYRDAVSTLDVTAVRAVWPDADAEALRKEFAAVRDQNLEFEGCRISGAGAGARASCAGVVESGFRPGDRRSRVERRRWQFTLQKSTAGWKITDVQSQRG